MCQQLTTDELSSFSTRFIDTTCVRVHQHAAGALKKRGQKAQAMGRSRGGLTTKIHLLCVSETCVIALFLRPGQTHDVTGFDSVFEYLPENHSIQNGVMDKVYDSNHVREMLEARQIKAVIPPN